MAQRRQIPLTDRYTLEDIAIACDDLESGKITGRAIVEF